MSLNTSLKIDHLREFLLLTEELNYTKVANAFYINQSSLSKHIAELEKTLEVSLFKRSSHSVQLSPYGIVFADAAKRILDAHDDAIASMSMMKREEDSVLRIGYLRDACRHFLPSACLHFAQLHPQTIVELTSLGPGEIDDAIRSGKIDAGIGIKTRYCRREGRRSVKVYDDDLELLVSANHPLLHKTDIMAADLEGFTVLAASPSKMPELSEFLIRQFEDHDDLASRIDFQEVINDGDSIEMLLSLGNKVAFVFHHQEGIFGEGFQNVPLCDMDLRCDICLEWKEGLRDDQLIDFSECVSKAYREHLNPRKRS